MVFSSSRTLPGQRYAVSAEIAPGDNSTLRPARAARVLQKCLNQQRNVFPPIPQGRYSNHDHAEAIEQILPKPLRRDFALEIDVGGGDDPDVHLHEPATADRPDFAFLQDSQQLDLKRRGCLADFIEKDGAAGGLLEDALSCPRSRQ